MKKHYIEFENGEASPLKVIGKAKQTGTQIIFTFKEIFFNKFVQIF